MPDSPAGRAVEAGAEAMHARSDSPLTWQACDRAFWRVQARPVIAAALEALASDPATAGLRAADLATELEAGHAG